MNIVNLRVIKCTAGKSMVLGVAYNYQHFPKHSNPTLGEGVGGIHMFCFRFENRHLFLPTLDCVNPPEREYV